MTQTLSLQYLGRAMNAVQDYLIQKLLIPKIYFDAKWNGLPVNVLAIDRSGSGDVHAVRFVTWEEGHTDNHGYSSFLEEAVFAEVEKFSTFQAHFRYVAVICSQSNKRVWKPDLILKHVLAEDGVGRVGILYVDLSENDASVEVLLKAERFRSSKELVEMADRFVAANTPNWQIPDEDRL